MRISDWSSDVCSSDLQGRRLCDETDGSAARRPGGSMTGTTQEGSAITMMRKTLLAGMAAFGLAMTAAPAAMAEDVTYLLPAPPSLPAFGPWMVAQQRGYFKAEGLNEIGRAHV